MDAAEEVNDGGASRGLLGGATAEYHVGQQHAHARARVRFDQEEDGAALFGRLLDPQRREDAVVDGVVEEQDLGRFNEDGGERQHVVFHQEADATRQYAGEHLDEGTDHEEGEDSQQHADETGGEVVDQHLEAALDAPFHHFVEALDGPATQRTDHHGTHEHGNVGTDDHAHGGDGTDHAAPFTAHQLAACIANQQRQQIGDHGADQLGQGFAWQPAGGNEESGNKAPGDESAYVGHDHIGQEASKILYLDFGIR